MAKVNAGYSLTKPYQRPERCRRQAAVIYARASVGLEGFSLSETDEAHAQRFIDGQISLQEFVQPRADALTLPKSSS
ncbi:MAG: hypothetical protein E2603_22800 [Achromobacter sp.]|nr:hypothetical protein [Achromobacter sp.]